MSINPIFFQVFGTYFDSDLVDLDDNNQLQKEAGFCASALSHRISELDVLISGLSKFLDEWDEKIVLRFINATNTDWFFDEETENSLRYIITEIIDGLKYYRLQRTRFTGEKKRKLRHL